MSKGHQNRQSLYVPAQLYNVFLLFVQRKHPQNTKQGDSDIQIGIVQADLSYFKAPTT